MADDVIDLATFSELQKSVGADFVVELVDTFLDEAPEIIAQLRAALAESDAESFRRAAHSLKANANTFGALALGRRAKALEQHGLPDDPSSLDALDAVYADAATALSELRNG